MSQMNSHIPVLLDEVVRYLITDSQGIYIDGTFGRGGHSQAILQRLSSQGRLLAIDKDPEAVRFAQSSDLLSRDPRFRIEQGSFAQIQAFAKHHLMGKVNGILLDLGVSSPQLDEAVRGFSFSREGPLDMRMDTTQGMSAAEWLSHVKEEELTQVLKEYGDEKYAKRIARAIVQHREQEPLVTTTQLSQLIQQVCPRYQSEKHPATRTFQAIRIYINHELDELLDFLNQCIEVLAPKGRLLVISFHSLEDRLVKRFLQREERGGDLPVGVPLRANELKISLRRIEGAIRPSEQERLNNPRARSATLRVMEKIA